MKHVISLEHQILLARKNKKLKAQTDRLLDALRGLVEVTDAMVLTPVAQKALDKARRAIELGNE